MYIYHNQPNIKGMSMSNMGRYDIILYINKNMQKNFGAAAQPGSWSGISVQDGHFLETALLGNISNRQLSEALMKVMGEIGSNELPLDKLNVAYSRWKEYKKSGDAKVRIPENLGDFFRDLNRSLNTSGTELFQEYKRFAEIIKRAPGCNLLLDDMRDTEGDRRISRNDLAIRMAEYAQPAVHDKPLYKKLKAALAAKDPESDYKFLNCAGTPMDALQGTDFAVIRTDKGTKERYIYRFDLTTNPNKNRKFLNVEVLQHPEDDVPNNELEQYYVDKIASYVLGYMSVH